MKATILEILNKNKELIEKQTNSYLYPDIQDKKIKNAKKSHKLDLYEEILYLRDLTLFGSASESTIITEKAISLVSSEGKPPQRIEWSKIYKVEYIDGNFYFFLDKDNDLDRIKWERSFPTDYSKKDDKYNKKTAKVLTEIANLFKNEEQILFKTIKNAFLNNKNDDALIKAQDYFHTYGDKGDYSTEIHYYCAQIYLSQKIYSKALNEIEFCIPESHEMELKNLKRSDIYVVKADILKALNKDYESLKYYHLAYENSTKKRNILDVQHKINTLNKKIQHEFLNYEYKDRKLILVDSEPKDFSSSSFKVIKKDSLPNIKFPIGHPIEQEIYVAHPFDKNIYFPLASFEETLFMSRFNELTYFLQCLGATKIEIISKRGKDVSETENSFFNLKAGISLKTPKFVGKANLDKENRKKTSNKSSYSKHVSRIQKFSPSKKPFLPSDLVWFHHEPDWQIIYKQRINGNLLYDKLNISTNQHQTITNYEKKKLQADFEAYAQKGKINITSEKNQMFNEKEITEWEIIVEFAPIETLTEENSHEEQYIDEIKFMLENDGVISEDERRLLERTRVRLGISEERAKQLEQKLLRN